MAGNGSFLIVFAHLILFKKVLNPFPIYVSNWRAQEKISCLFFLYGLELWGGKLKKKQEIEFAFF